MSHLRLALLRCLPLALAFSLLLGGCPRSGGGSGGGTTGPGGGAGGGAPPTPAERAKILATSDLPAELPKPLPGDPMGVTIHRLSNGMTVYISTDRQHPRFTAWMAVRTGSRNDPANSTGLAHYLEHMLFKGSGRLGTTDIGKERAHIDRIAQLYDDLRKVKDEAGRAAVLKTIDEETQKSAAFAIPNELDQLYAAIGIQGVNAFTSNDQTVYITDVPSNRLAQWAAIEGDRFQHPEFRLFWPELEAVYEEKNQTLDSPEDRMWEAMALLLFPGHPYGTQSTIGTVEHLKVPAYRDMSEYFARWYVPNNMALLLAGDIDAATALPILEKAFAGMQPKRLPELPAAPIKPPSARGQAVIEAEGEQGLMIAWQTVAERSPDRVALEVMDLLVDNATSGLLNLELVLTQKLPRAGSGLSFMTESGLWLLTATAREGQSLDEVEKLLLGVVDKLKAGQFRQEDLDAIVLNEEIQRKQALESNDARVNTMMDAYIGRVPWPDQAAHLDRMRKVTREDVIRVAQRYLGSNFVLVQRINKKYAPPKIDKPKITPVALDTSRQSPLAHEVVAMSIVPLEPQFMKEGEHYERVKLPAGPMIAARNTRHDLFTVSYEFDVGSKRQRLLCHALELLDRSGAKGLSPEDLKRRLFAMGTTVETTCSQDETTIEVSGIDANLEPSVALLDSWLRTATFDAGTVKALAANQVSQRNDAMRDSAVIGQALGEWVSRDKDSPFVAVPSNRELLAARGPALGALLARLPDLEHRTLYFGPRSGAEAAKVISLGVKHKKLAAPPPLTYRKADKTRVFLVDRQDVAQAQVRVVWPRGPLAAEDRVVADLFTEYVGGNMGALVFQEIREARGLAYRAGARYLRGNRKGDQAALLGVLGTQADKTLDALTTLLSLLREMPLQEQRFATAQKTIDSEVRATRFDPRNAADLVAYWDDLGEPADPRPREWEKLKGLKPADLAAFAKRAAEGGANISIMGNATRIDRKALEAVGPVEAVPVKKLFNY